MTTAEQVQTPCDHVHLDELRRALDDFGRCVDIADDWGVRLAAVLEGGGRLLAAGNGGSAAQAQHLTAELVGRYRKDRPPYSAICLTAETSSLTAICNDYPADELFARQVEAHGRPGDVLVLMSTSGTSANIVAAAERGRRAGLEVWSMTGPEPNPLAAASSERAVRGGAVHRDRPGAPPRRPAHPVRGVRPHARRRRLAQPSPPGGLTWPSPSSSSGTRSSTPT